MKKVQFFYAYECPFCKRGYEALANELGSHPGVDIEWRPVETHPLPEEYFPHTHLACQSYYIAEELGADMARFHTAMFQAVAVERKNVEKPEVLCEILKDIVDAGKFRSILDSGKYAGKPGENNDLAYEKSGVWYLPAFRADGKNLDAKGGEGINPGELRDYFKKL